MTVFHFWRQIYIVDLGLGLIIWLQCTRFDFRNQEHLLLDIRGTWHDGRRIVYRLDMILIVRLYLGSPQAVLPSSEFFSVSRWGQVCPCVPSHSVAWSSACTCKKSPQLSCRSWRCHPGTGVGSAVSGSGQWRNATPERPAGSSSSLCDPQRQSSWAAVEPADTPQHIQAPWWGWRWCTGHRICTWWTSAPCSPPGSGLGLEHEIWLEIRSVDVLSTVVATLKSVYM